MISPRISTQERNEGKHAQHAITRAPASMVLGGGNRAGRPRARADGREGGAAMACLYLVVIVALVAIIVIFVSIAVRRSERREAEEPTHWEDIDRRLW